VAQPPAGAAIRATAAATSGQARQNIAAEAKRVLPEKALPRAQHLQRAVREVNAFVQRLQRDLRFRVDADSGKIIVSVVDSRTQEVIRQIPPDTILEQASHLSGGTGLLLHAKG